MNITFAPRGILQIDDASIIYKNFAGVGSKFNREGDRNFAVRIPDTELAKKREIFLSCFFLLRSNSMTEVLLYI